MTHTINRNQTPTMPIQFYQLIEKELTNINPQEASAITLNFRDPDYSAESGGFHPVEVRLEKHEAHWHLVYVTDFAYHGQPYPELVKQIDICFNRKQVYSLYSGWLSEREGQSLINLFSDNFVAYHNMDVYQVHSNID